MSGDTEQELGDEIARVRHGQDVTASDLANRLMPWLDSHDAELTERVRAEQREIDALTVLNTPLDSSHRRILRRDLATAVREASDD